MLCLELRVVIFATMWLEAEFKKANPSKDDCLRDFTLPDVKE